MYYYIRVFIGEVIEEAVEEIHEFGISVEDYGYADEEEEDTPMQPVSKKEVITYTVGCGN